MATNRPGMPADISNQTAISQAAAIIASQIKEKKPGGEGMDDSGKTTQERHDQRRGWYLTEISRQSANRTMMARCEAFYDSEQISAEDAQVMEDRGQKPVVYNEVFYIVNWLIGTERRGRVDFNVVAEGDEEEDSEDASNKSKLLKMLDDVNRAGFERSQAASDAFKAGLGWMEVGLRGDKTGIPIFIGAESWRNMLWDSHSRRMDLSDARYVMRWKPVDLDVAIAIFPDKKIELESAAQTGDQLSMFGGWGGQAGIHAIDGKSTDSDRTDDFNSVNPVDGYNSRERVVLLEVWSREPIRRKLKGGLGDPVTFRMRCSIMTELDTLVEDWSPFAHDETPFIPVWAYRNARTGLPYGPIRPLLGPQEALNHRMSKSLYEASANQMEIEKGAIDAGEGGMTLTDLQAEWNSPDGVAVYADGALSNNRVRQKQNPGAAAQQIMLAERDITTIRHMSGIDSAAQGLKSNLSSGIALKTNNDNVGLLTSELFDNQLLSRQLEGERVLSMAEQFIKQPMTVRVAGEGASQGERVKINEPGGYDENGQPYYLNDISARRAHFVVGEQAWKQSYAEGAFTELMNVLTQLASAAPQVVIGLLDVVFEMHPNLPRKRAVLERIRMVNGMSDPDGKLTPEQQQAQAEKARVAKQRFDLEMAQLQAEVKLANAKGDKLSVDAMVQRITALYEAAQGAAVLAASPAITPIADAMLASGGYVDQSGSPQTLGPDGTPMAAAPMQPTGNAAAAAPPEAAQQSAQMQAPELQQADGAQRGIETMRNDGAQIPTPPGAAEQQPQGEPQ